MSRNSRQRSVCRCYSLPWVGVDAFLVWRQYWHRSCTTHRVPEAQPLRYFVQHEHLKIVISQKIARLKFVSRHSSSVEAECLELYPVRSYVHGVLSTPRQLHGSVEMNPACNSSQAMWLQWYRRNCLYPVAWWREMQRGESRQFCLSAYRISLTKGPSNAGQCDGY
jgi:hypothetical protein